MKKYLCIIPLLVLLCFVVSCQNKAAMAELEKYKAQAAVEEQNKALVTRFFEAYTKGDIEALKEILSPELIAHDWGKNNSLKDMFETIKGNMESFSENTFTLEDIIAKGDRVATRNIVKGTLKGTKAEGEASIAEGTKIELALYSIERVENGKIVEVWMLQDDLSLYKQVGYELKPKEEK